LTRPECGMDVLISTGKPCQFAAGFNFKNSSFHGLKNKLADRVGWANPKVYGGKYDQ